MPEIDKIWKELKKKLKKAFILRYSDFIKPFILYTDTSKKEVNVIFAQYNKKAKVNYVVKYFSRSLK